MNNEYIITLLETERLGRVSVNNIIENTKHNVTNLADLLDCIEETSYLNKRIAVPNLDALKRANDVAQQIIDKSIENDIKVIGKGSQNYPKQFLEIANHPVLIYCKGNLDLLNEYRSVAVIGTREPSNAGKKLGERITEIFVKNNYNIVSGLAIGCDTIAHKSCLTNNGKTIAVLANGLDYVYPKENCDLADEIINKDGLIISEYPVGRKPMNNFFVERDRLQSGFSQAICVIETDIKGGTMHTVGFAEKQGRLISCINHPEENRNHPKVNGNQMLINSKRAYSLGNPDEINKFIFDLNNKVDKAIAFYKTSALLNDKIDNSQLSLDIL
jgi:DNA processing protein